MNKSWSVLKVKPITLEYIFFLNANVWVDKIILYAHPDHPIVWADSNPVDFNSDLTLNQVINYSREQMWWTEIQYLDCYSIGIGDLSP